MTKRQPNIERENRGKVINGEQEEGSAKNTALMYAFSLDKVGKSYYLSRCKVPLRQKTLTKSNKLPLRPREWVVLTFV